MSRPAGLRYFETSQGTLWCACSKAKRQRRLRISSGLLRHEKNSRMKKPPEGKETFLRRIDLPSRDSAIHDSGGCPQGNGRAAGLQVCGRVSSFAEASKPESSPCHSGPGTTGASSVLPCGDAVGLDNKQLSLAKSSKGQDVRTKSRMCRAIRRPPENTGVHHEFASNALLKRTHRNAHARRLLRFLIELICPCSAFW